MKALGQMHPSALLRPLTIALALCCASGCSSQKDEMTKQLESLQKEVNRLRSSNLTIQDRVDALEEDSPSSPSDHASDDGDDGGVDDRPVLEVVRLSPQESLAEPPVVVMTPVGDPNAARPAIVGDARGVERQDEETPKAPKKPRRRKQ
jgi:hypothetical protein